MPRTVSKYLAKGTEFLPEADHVHVDGALGHGIIVAVDLLDDLAAGKHPAGPAGQEVEEVKFHQGQFQRSARQQDFVAAGIDEQILSSCRGALASGGAAVRRRSAVLIRASKTRGLKGLVT